MWENRKYVILTVDEVGAMTDANYNTILFSQSSELPWNRDETKAIVKYEGSKPSWLTGKSTMTWAEMRTEVAKDEWAPEE